MSTEPPEPTESPREASPERSDAKAKPSPPRRLELVISSELGLDSIPPGDPAAPSEPRRTDSIPPPSTVHNRVATSVLSGSVSFGSAEARMIRSLAGWIGLTGLATVGISITCAVQWATGRASVPSAVIAVLMGGIGLWSLLAGWHFGRALRKEREGAHQLVRSFSNLRSIFILKAVTLFLSLALGCFAFSIVASLLALL
ncbi:MAG: hypothetical protein M3Y87_24080 [Myxococcota bacterium]|nr:hypothetical protein [Myxococcota bacterium]